MSAPREASADIRMMASTLHQVFSALTQEGFTEQQALTVIAIMINAQAGNS